MRGSAELGRFPRSLPLYPLGPFVVFSDPVFLFLFLPAVLLAVALAPRAAKNVVLLAVSLFFYAWGEQEIVLVMLASIAVNHALALWIAGSAESGSQPRRRKWLLTAGVTFNLGVLVAFKYTNWLWSEAQALLTTFGVERAADWDLPPIHLPIGVSFFTFQALSYLVDVYREQVRVRRSPVHFALYIALFPQLIAGPIVRYTDLAPQLAERKVKSSDVAEGLRRFVIGLGKKVLIADVLAGPADLAFASSPGEISSPVAWLGLICFSLQIYFDFSAYSDMAIGLSRVFGFRLLENFCWPMIAESLTEFWRRWHISLSSWFRDYLYIPLGGSRRGPATTYFNLTIVFLLCGLWHGASWTFVVWGLFHGAVLVIERAGFSQVLARSPRPLRHIYLCCVVICSWIFFRATGLAEAGGYMRVLFGQTPHAPPVHTLALVLETPVALALIAGVIGSTPVVTVLSAKLADANSGTRRTLYDLAEASTLLLVVFASIVKLAADGFHPFIYLRF